VGIACGIIVEEKDFDALQCSSLQSCVAMPVKDEKCEQRSRHRMKENEELPRNIIPVSSDLSGFLRGTVLFLEHRRSV
jgi:hypothetical protein